METETAQAIPRCRVTDKNIQEYGRLWKVHSDFLKIVVADQVNIMVKRICDRKRLVSGMQREIRKNGGIPEASEKETADTAEIGEGGRKAGKSL